VELVKAQFIQDPNADEQTAGQAESQASDIDEGITFMAFDVAPYNFEIIFQHSPSPYCLERLGLTNSWHQYSGLN